MTASPPSPATQDVVRKPERSLRAAGLSLGYDDRLIVDSIEVTLPPGRITVIVGANACGKSTLLRGMARLLPARGGEVLLDGKDIRSLPGRELAKIVGILPQNPIAPEGITVADLVGRGRYPHQGWFGRPSAEDNRIVAEAMAQTAVAELGERRVSELSGGQRQRVWIAMAIAQDADVLLLDEPTTFLDIAHQVEVLDLLTELNRERGTTVAMVLHDLNLAARYADELIVMADGRIVAQGAPAEVLSTDVLFEAFSLRAQLIDDPVSHTPLIVPLGRFHS